MAEISLICATPPGPNPGMASVDIAFHALAGRYGFRDSVRSYQLYTLEELYARKEKPLLEEMLLRQQLPFSYQNARDHMDRILESDAIVFWGDFFHMASYTGAVASRLLKAGAVSSLEEGRAVADRHLFLTEAPERVLEKVLVFGGTLLLNRPLDYRDKAYATKLGRLVRGARQLWMRDPYSALTVSRLRGETPRLTLGVDCALLLEPGDLAPLERSAWGEEPESGRSTVGIFFGRSQCEPRTLARFCRELCQRLGLEAEWLPWGMHRGFEDYAGAIGRSFPGLRSPTLDGPPRLGDLFERIDRSALIVSDTYHLCVNAWRAGVPAVCVGEALPRTPWSVNSGSEFAWRDKRQVFYAMNELSDFYVYAEELGDRSRRRRRIDHLVELLRDRGLIESAQERLREQAKHAGGEFVAELHGLCEESASHERT